MKKGEIVKKNINLTFDFMRNIVDNPDTLNAIPDGSEVDFIETDLPRYIVKNRVEDAVEPVVFRVEHTFHGIVQKSEKNIRLPAAGRLLSAYYQPALLNRRSWPGVSWPGCNELP